MAWEKMCVRLYIVELIGIRDLLWRKKCGETHSKVGLMTGLSTLSTSTGVQDDCGDCEMTACFFCPR